MRKNQNGVSMVSLVITIIVIIILAAVAFTGSQETISRAGFSGFVTDIDSVRTAFLTEGVTNLMGEEEAKNNTVSAAQAYNYLAKGATTLTGDDAKEAWLTKAQANTIQCTRIEPATAEKAIGITLPERTVNTESQTKMQMSFYVTNKGDIFVWPPYEKSDDGKFYLNDVDTVENPYSATPTFHFASGATVTIATTAVAAADLGKDASFTDLAGIRYNDADISTITVPQGIETDAIFQNSGDTGLTRPVAE